MANETNFPRESCLPKDINPYITITLASLDPLIFFFLLIGALRNLKKYVKGPIKKTLYAYLFLMLFRMMNILIYELFVVHYLKKIKDNDDENHNIDIVIGQIKDFINICLSAFVF